MSENTSHCREHNRELLNGRCYECLEKELAASLEWEDRYRKALKNQIQRWKMLPMGIDESADENNTSPDDAVAHIGGLAVREIKEALGKEKDV